MNNSNILDLWKYHFSISVSVKSFSFNILSYSSFHFGGVIDTMSYVSLGGYYLNFLTEHLSFHKDLSGKLEQGMPTHLPLLVIIPYPVGVTNSISPSSSLTENVCFL